MSSTRRPRRTSLVLVAAACLMPSSAAAHPGTGIVVDRYGQVYFVDMVSGVWKLSARGVLTHIPGPGFHWMGLDADGHFTATPLPSGSAGDIVRLGTDPTLLLASDFPIAVGGDGNVYFPSHDGRTPIEIVRLLPSGQRSTLASLPAIGSGAPLRDLNGLAAGPDGSLYLTDDASIRRVSRAGLVSTIVAGVTIAGCPSPLLRGLAVDAGDTVYVAATGCGRVLKVTPAGGIAVVSKSPGTWAPTGVALFGHILYVLEFQHPLTDDRREMLPRIRMVTPDGRAVIIATVSSH
jgi:hypothetical protein